MATSRDSRREEEEEIAMEHFFPDSQPLACDLQLDALA